MNIQPNIDTGGDIVADCIHLSEAKREAGLANFLARLPHQAASAYWFAERSCREAGPKTSAAAARRDLLRTLRYRVGNVNARFDELTVSIAQVFITTGRKSEADLDPGVMGDKGNAGFDKPSSRPVCGNVVVADLTEKPGFARFVVRVESKHPGAIGRWLSGRPISSMSPAPQSGVEDFWFLLEDGYNEILEENGGNTVLASRWYLKSLLKSAPTVLANRRLRTSARKKSRA